MRFLHIYLHVVLGTGESKVIFGNQKAFRVIAREPNEA
jgi:hypothetical protein